MIFLFCNTKLDIFGPKNITFTQKSKPVSCYTAINHYKAQMTKEQEQFVKKCKKDGFDYDQITQINWGFRGGLSIEQIQFYAKKEFHWYQMNGIRLGFEYKLTCEQIKLYAKPEFDSEQMNQIRLGFCEDDLTIEQVLLYARPDFLWPQMYNIRKMFQYSSFLKVQTTVALMILEK